MCPKCNGKGFRFGVWGWQPQWCDCPAGDAAKARVHGNATQGVTPTTALPPAPGTQPEPACPDCNDTGRKYGRYTCDCAAGDAIRQRAAAAAGAFGVGTTQPTPACNRCKDSGWERTARGLMRPCDCALGDAIWEQPKQKAAPAEETKPREPTDDEVKALIERWNWKVT